MRLSTRLLTLCFIYRDSAAGAARHRGESWNTSEVSVSSQHRNTFSCWAPRCGALDPGRHLKPFLLLMEWTDWEQFIRSRGTIVESRLTFITAVNHLMRVRKTRCSCFKTSFSIWSPTDFHDFIFSRQVFLLIFYSLRSLWCCEKTSHLVF